MFLLFYILPFTFASLKERITTYEVTLPTNLLGRETNWRAYAYSSLSVRLYPSSDSSSNYYVGYTDANGLGTVLKIKSQSNKIQRTDTFKGYSVRGLHVLSDGTYGILLWDTKTSLIYFRKVSHKGKEEFTKPLGLRTAPFPSSVPAGSDKGYGIGDSRVNYGDGKFHIYTHVHSDNGHEGDALFTVTDDGTVQQIWGWGCSHMMSGLQGWNSNTKTMIHICDSDAYPSTGMFAENSVKYTLYKHAGNGGGMSAGELGGVVENGDGWLLIMNSIQPESASTANPQSAIQDIGVVSINANKTRSKVDFIKISDKKKSNGCIAKFEGNFLVGYKQGTDFFLGSIDSNAKIMNDFENVTDVTGWGDRDDSFRNMEEGGIFWVRAPNDKGNILIITEFSAAFGNYMINVMFCALFMMVFL
ncbi:hypothetical protein EIN_362330 [Entamoeba invadens IP1]|uniref:Uncharacterized protein n=1 Tax=Entamoeba invadens IP1 TaxID=370355 RepID=A0A0A1U816_ENTIV|nr:hypothetical protein EIN_362330 [Entamoeba invadens IP1]ELP90940.1 hypothetical protein EIN_362330 [Entamoeba invadens IP1]|eukprot:XP_004257711.1 hypothetical protein EIN_362330 [Entamoeba invadens IP1]